MTKSHLSSEHTSTYFIAASRLDRLITYAKIHNATHFAQVQSCRNLKGNVVLFGETFDEAKVHALKMRNEKGLVYIDGYVTKHAFIPNHVYRGPIYIAKVT